MAYQLLKYLTWRDTKAALVVFIRNADASAVIDSAATATLKHGRCKGPASSVCGLRSYRYAHDGDESREITLVLVPIVLRAAD